MSNTGDDVPSADFVTVFEYGTKTLRNPLHDSFLYTLCVLFALPFTSLSASESAVAVTVLIVAGESLFAIGGLIAGKSLLESFRRKLIPRRLRREKQPMGSEE